MDYSLNQLDNGLKILSVPDDNAPSATIMVLVATGSRFEDETNLGIAHFIEHTIFKGSQTRPTSKQVAMEIEMLGGNSNAFTGYEYTGYYIKVPKHNILNAVEILGDIVLNPLFPEEELEKEKGVVIEEIRMYEDIPMEKIQQHFREQLFAKHPLGRDIAGTVESVSKLDRGKIMDFVQQFYNSSNMLIVVSGNYQEDQLRSKLEETFASVEVGNPANSVKAEPRKLTQPAMIHPAQTEQTHIVMGGFAPEKSSAIKHQLKIGNALLGYGFGSLLFQKIREEMGAAYYVNASVSGYKDIGNYEIRMGVENTKADAAIRAAIEQLLVIAEGGFDQQELERAKNYFIGILTTHLETSDEVAQWYGLNLLLEGEIQTAEQIITKINAFEKDDIVQAWQQLITKDNLQINLLGQNVKLDSRDYTDMLN